MTVKEPLDHGKVLTVYVILMVMIILDMILTMYALSTGNYYETNPFTKVVGPTAHAMILLAISYILAYWTVKKDSLPLFITLSAMTVVWMLNNLYSVYLLVG